MVEKMKAYLRFARHAVFLLIALIAGSVGVFWVGVRMIGDNPGALFGGVACFLLAFSALVGIESIWISRIFRGGRWLGLFAEITLSFCAVVGGLEITERIGLSALSIFAYGQWEMALFVCVFLALDCLLYWLGKAALRKTRLGEGA
jgi:hypothetical protein